MAWRKKTLALFTCIILSSLLFLQGYINLLVKLPTRDYRHKRPHDPTSGTVRSGVAGEVKSNGVGEVKINLKPGFYKIIKTKPLDNASIFGNGRKIYQYSKNYNDIVIPRPDKRQRFSSDLLDKNAPIISDGRHGNIDWTEQADDTVAKEHAQRIQNLQNACHDAAMYRRREQRKGNLSEFFYSRAHKFAYCKVPKSGSTFWMNVFMILSRGENYSKLVSRMSRAEIHERTRLFITDPGRILHNNIPTIMSSRNPFSRLFSAYVDKVFIPLFWQQFTYMNNVTVLPSYYINDTIDILKSSNVPLSSRLAKYKDSLREKGMLIQKNVTQKITPVCANNASFEDFLRFIISEIKSNRALEPHWAPISHLCHPCKFNTFKIIKQETFSKDVEHTLKSVGVNLARFEWLENSLNENRAENSIPGIIAVIRNKFKQRSVSNCINQTGILIRLWKSLQIQGFINKGIDFPQKLLHLDWNKYSHKVTEVVLDAISQKPMTSADRLEQRDYFLKQAYSELPSDVISDIQDIYYLDFILFDYSVNPPK
ncbi:uncharacterized protein LOC123535013 [Mercenaria mercenaria]|uniref:uncharacterized protein LOC123535013 n=1 Tax=Mercenaria mercenaria TaxID=6596 RepID=UPI00234EBD27|nr:uncharacterized protein LOC123535013 [Mercenaria mercenaria]